VRSGIGGIAMPESPDVDEPLDEVEQVLVRVIADAIVKQLEQQRPVVRQEEKRQEEVQDARQKRAS
jgi:hypothetical protein